MHLIQLLCPARHCVLGAIYDPERETKEECIKMLDSKRREFRMHPWCGLCGSTKLEYEDRVTGFESVSDALPFAAELQVANAMARAIAAGLPKPN